jgi:hypothetical protein
VSGYLRAPGVPPVTINAYPKRRFSSYFTTTITSRAGTSRIAMTAATADPCYADFFQQTDVTVPTRRSIGQLTARAASTAAA